MFCKRIIANCLACLMITATPLMAFGKVQLVTWNDTSLPQMSSSAELLFRDPRPFDLKNDGRASNLVAAISAHAVAQPRGWASLVDRVRQAGGDIAKLTLTNKIINSIAFVDGTDGTYFSPAKLFARGGVCKDFAVSKLLLLRDAGFPVDRLRLVSMTPRLDHPDEALHVVLVAKSPELKQPLVLNIKSPQAEKDSLRGITKKERMAEVKTAGIDLDEINSDGTSDPFMKPLSEYGADRGVLWSASTTGAVSLAIAPESQKKTTKPAKNAFFLALKSMPILKVKKCYIALDTIATPTVILASRS